MNEHVVQVVAHRGASHQIAEHTLSAYLAAVDLGADAVECDVRVTADGHLVCVHDRDLRRVANLDRRVSTMELTELQGLDFSTWKRPWADLDDEADPIDLAGGGVLTMRELIETMLAVDRRIEFAIETKHPTRYGGLVEERLISLLGEYDLLGPDSPARVMSFSLTAMQRVRRLAPNLKVVMLFDQAERWPLLRRSIGPTWLVGPGIAELRDHPWLRDRLRESVRRGREVHVWTVNTKADLDLCLDIGVKAVITDKPGDVRRWLDG